MTTKKIARSTKTCPECGGKMHYKTQDDVLTYKGQKKKIKTKAWWCTSCGEAILSGNDLTKRDKAFRELKAKADGLLTPKKVARIRNMLGISQRKAGEILGGGPRAFQKYESGNLTVSSAMSNLLRLLKNDPRRIDELLEESD